MDNVLKAEGHLSSSSDPGGEVLINPAFQSESDEEGKGGEEEGVCGRSDAWDWKSRDERFSSRE